MKDLLYKPLQFCKIPYSVKHQRIPLAPNTAHTSAPGAIIARPGKIHVKMILTLHSQKARLIKINER